MNYTILRKRLVAATVATIGICGLTAEAGWRDSFSPSVVCETGNGWELKTITGAEDICYVFYKDAELTIPQDCLAEVLIVGGGGGGGTGWYGGGGGAGGLIRKTAMLLGQNTYSIVIGNGGAAQQNGSDSSAFGLTAVGGGKGGSGPMNTPGGTGGSGGGASNRSAGGSATAGQGNAGGATSNYAAGGGGGGAGSAGAAANGNDGGNGGDGIADDITGSTVVYAAGGGGASTNPLGGRGGSDGVGGRGSGNSERTAEAGAANTGSGGGGGSTQGYSAAPGKGADGVVVVRITGLYDPQNPLINDVKLKSVGSSSVTVERNVASCGSASNTCTLKAIYGLDVEHFDNVVTLDGACAVGKTDSIVSGLIPNRSYLLRLRVENSYGSFDSPIVSFTTGNGEYTHTDSNTPYIMPGTSPVGLLGNSYRFSGALSANGVVNGVTVKVAYGSSPNNLDSELTTTSSADGKWIVSGAHGNAGETVYYQVSAECVGEYDRTEVLSATLVSANFAESLEFMQGRVNSSSYATGGDLIFYLEDKYHAEYVHVFTNTASANFVPQAAMNARILLVGGGGAGGSWRGGGGGAGGFREIAAKALTAEAEYAVVVGAGGARAVSFDKYGGDGGSSSFGDESVLGGGAGGTYHWNKAGRSGSSGGGAASADGSPYVYGGTGTDGQGFGGANSPSTSARSGGGGGAGGAGLNGGTDDYGYSSLSDGGIGKVSDILGYEMYFAGGGAGYNSSGVSYGGEGGGGKAEPGSVNGEDGENGRGGGGGGAGNAKLCGGAGGSGIVIVSYVDPAKTAPFLSSLTVGNDSAASMSVKGTVGGLGAGASSCAVYLDYWPDDDPSDVTTEKIFETDDLAANAAFATSVARFDFDSAYGWKVRLVNNVSVAVDFDQGSFQTYSGSMAATGGEKVLLDGTFDYVHTFADSGTFTATGSGFVRVLIVAGGGGGGKGADGGGGGAGGVIYERALFVPAGTYPVTVGFGGAAENPGMNSSVFGLTAIGGGKGGSGPSGTPGGNGGSGGGACNRSSGGKGTPGQGFAGGNSYDGWSYGGGGGGAGERGQDASNPNYAGKGGDGVAYDISGETVIYAAGGGGAFCTGGSAGANAPNIPGEGGSNGVGGRGCDKDNAATDGAEHTGSGGGGGCGHKAAGKGGKGIVIIRYTDLEEAAKQVAPVVDFPEYGELTENSVAATVSLATAGGGKSSAAVYAIFGYESGVYIYTNLLNAAFSGDSAITINGLSPSRTYFMRLLADNGLQGGTALSKEQTFTTLPALDAACSVSGSGTNRTFIGTVNGLADGTSTVSLLLGTSSSSLLSVETMTPSATGQFQLTHNFSSDDFGKTFYYAFVQENTLGPRSWTCSTVTNSFVIVDGNTYTWKGGEGDWRDAEMWTSSVPGTGRGFPVYGSTAKIQAAEVPSVIRIANAECVQELNLSGNVTFKGTAPGAEISFVSSDKNYGFGCDVTFDGVRFLAGQGNIGGNRTLRLINGAYLYFSSWNFSLGGGSVLEVASESFFSARMLLGGNDSTIIVDGGEITPWGGSLLTYNGGTCNVIIRGDGSKYTVNGDNLAQDRGPVYMTFEIPKDGYTNPPIVGSLNATHGVVVNVPRTAPIHRQNEKKFVQLTTANVNSAQVTFGECDNALSKFYYSDTGTDAGSKLWYTHASTGIIIILK